MAAATSRWGKALMCCTTLCCGPRTGPIRMLVAHADESYEEWGYSGSLVYEPGT